MLYRVMIGMIPTVLIALFISGAIPMSSVLPTSGYHASAAKGGANTSDSRSARNLPEAAVTPGQVSEVFRGVDASLDAEIKRRAPEEKRRKERIRRLHERADAERRGVSGDWAPTPSGGGWGR